MDLLKLAVLQIAASFKPANVEELHKLADEMMEWLRRDLPVVDDETALELVITPEGMEH
jgi:hypothetical protein